MLSRSVFLPCLCVATLASAQDWALTATVSQSPEGPPDPRTGRAVLVQHFAATCTPPVAAAPTFSSPGISTRFVASPDEEFPVSGALGVVTAEPTLSGSVRTSSPVLGAKVFPLWEVRCAADLAGGSPPLVVRGPAVISAPWVAPQLAPLALDGEGPLDTLRVGRQARLLGSLEGNPRGAERVTVHLEGAGVSIHRAYGFTDGDLTTAFNNDPLTVFTPRTAGTLRVWADLDGVESEVRTLEVQPGEAPPPDEPSPGLSCSTSPVALALLCVALLRRGGVR